MKHIIDRAYAAQRLESYRKVESRQRDEALRGAGWALFFLLVSGALAAAGIIG